MYIEQIIVKYKYKIFKTILPIYRELLLYILYTTYSIKLGIWAKYNTTIGQTALKVAAIII